MSNEKNLTPEMLEQAKSAPSAEALLTLAQENDIALTAEQAETYYAQLHPEMGALSDEELDNVSGGGLCYDESATPPKRCEFCEHTEFEYIRVVSGGVTHHIWVCKNCRRSN